MIDSPLLRAHFVERLMVSTHSTRRQIEERPDTVDPGLSSGRGGHSSTEALKLDGWTPY